MTEEQEQLKKFLIQMTAPLEKLFEAEQTISPMWIFDGKDGLGIIATPWGNDEEKRHAVAMVKGQMKEQAAHRYVYIGESWMLIAQKESDIPESIRLGGKIASHPDRREAIIAVAEDKQGNCAQMIRYILRPKHEKATLASPEFLNFTSKDTEGLLTHLLQD